MGINSWYLFLNLVELGIIPIDTEVCIHYKISDGHFPTRGVSKYSSCSFTSYAGALTLAVKSFGHVFL